MTQTFFVLVYFSGQRNRDLTLQTAQASGRQSGAFDTVESLQQDLYVVMGHRGL